MEFLRRSGSRSDSSIRRDGSSSSLASSLNGGINGAPSKKPSTSSLPSFQTSSRSSSSSMPTRMQRMRLLKCIIHHADAVQKQYLVPKQLPSTAPPKPDGGSTISIDNMSSIFVRVDRVTAEINDKCYQRWHQVLQEGLVPMSVHALNLLEPGERSGGGDAADDEEEDYLATMEGMEEEIRVMAILARAAALEDAPGGVGIGRCAERGSTRGDDGMEQINSMMKCAAMLLFHVVLASSSPEKQSPDSPQKNVAGHSLAETKAVAGYDGRVRHVMKLACVDVLALAILEGVESFDDVGVRDEGADESQVVHAKENPLWNIDRVKEFLDQADLGKDAVFGTPFESASAKKLLEEGGADQASKREKRQSQPDTDEQTEASEAESTRSQRGANEQGSAGDMPTKTVDSVDSVVMCDMSPPLELKLDATNGHDQSFEDTSHSVESDVNMVEDGTHQSDQSMKGRIDLSIMRDSVPKCGDEGTESISMHKDQQESDEHGTNATRDGQGDEDLTQLQLRRRVNAKFLATRKFELIERLVAIDIVRFLMAEEREKKLREKELEDQKNHVCKGGSDGASAGDSGAEGSEAQSVSAAGSSQYFTASRVQQIKRGAKIAGAGLAIGTVFAITGGLAAPALAAGIGGVAALAGASTTSSAALLAVLATFKAGAALFGVGGGGLAAYRMKKRTAGLTQFEIRRENIEQYMYDGASEEKLKKGIETMLPQLHTTVAVTGWLRANDIADFQLAWGIQPTCQYDKSNDDALRIRQMKRFYSIYNPPLVNLCGQFMQALQRRLKKDFSWDRIWEQIEKKYGANPDHMIPVDSPYDNEVFLTNDERQMIDGVLTDAKISNLRKKGLGAGEIDLNETDEIAELLAKVSPKKRQRRATADSESDLELETMENELVRNLEHDIALKGSDMEVEMVQMSNHSDKKKFQVEVPSDNTHDVPPETSPTLQQTMEIQREQQVSFLKSNGPIEDESTLKQEIPCLKEGSRSPKMAGEDSPQKESAQDPPLNSEDAEGECDKGRCPVVWDWKRLYGSADIHTVTWESKMLSSLCHIVENMAMEVSTQATKVALQYSVIGAIISAIAIPSALITASKLIDDPYQIVVIRADAAGKELARCLLQSDERRPVTLLGFSFGARVIYSCLRELARQQEIWEESRASTTTDGAADEKKLSRSSSFLPKKSKDERRFEYDREPASLVGDVIFIGLPRAIDKKILTSCRRVTGGRLVNCYTRNDWLLSLMFVARGGTPCGIKPIKDVPGVENYDVTDMVESHTKYADAIPRIMQHVRFSEP